MLVEINTLIKYQLKNEIQMKVMVILCSDNLRCLQVKTELDETLQYCSEVVLVSSDPMTEISVQEDDLKSKIKANTKVLVITPERAEELDNIFILFIDRIQNHS